MNGKNRVYCNALISIIIVMLTLCISQNTGSKISNNNPEHETQETVKRMLYRMLYIPDYQVFAEETSFLKVFDLAAKNLTEEADIELFSREFERQVWEFMSNRFSDICTDEVIMNLIRNRFPLSTPNNMSTHQFNQFIEDIELTLISSDDIAYRYRYTVRLRLENESVSESKIVKGRIYVELLDGKFVVTTCSLPAFYKAD